MSRRGVFAIAAAALAMGTLVGGAATSEAAPTAQPTGAPTPRRRRSRAWFLGDGTSAQTNHMRAHGHARENARRRRQMARDAAKGGTR